MRKINSKDIAFESNVKNVLEDDGISEIDLLNENKLHTKLSTLTNLSSKKSWAKRIIFNEICAAHIICQNPGETNRTHFHQIHDEWWVVLDGEIKWWIEGEDVICAEKGDIIFAPRGKQHKIKTTGTRKSLRLAISPPDIPHYHPKIDNVPDDF